MRHTGSPGAAVQGTCSLPLPSRHDQPPTRETVLQRMWRPATMTAGTGRTLQVMLARRPSLAYALRVLLL